MYIMLNINKVLYRFSAQLMPRVTRTFHLNIVCSEIYIYIYFSDFKFLMNSDFYSIIITSITCITECTVFIPVYIIVMKCRLLIN